MARFAFESQVSQLESVTFERSANIAAGQRIGIIANVPGIVTTDAVFTTYSGTIANLPEDLVIVGSVVLSNGQITSYWLNTSLADIPGPFTLPCTVLIKK